MMATASQTRKTIEDKHGWQRIFGKPMSGKGTSVGTAVTEAICASDYVCE
jgi:hypothetical protein